MDRSGVEAVKGQIQRLTAGLTHSQRERLALDLAEVASGESCQFLKCDSGTLTAYFPQEARRLAQSKPEPAVPQRPPRSLKEWQARKAGVALTSTDINGKPIKDPLPLWERERERYEAEVHPAIRAGIRDKSIRTAADYRRMKKALGLPGAA